MLQCPATRYDDLGQAILLKSKQVASSSLDMDESELEQIRKARLEQLKAQGGGNGGGGGARSGGGSGQEERQRHQLSPLRQAEEARQQILNQILHPEAADRLGRIRLVKEQRATDVENRLITLAQTGQLRQKVTEEQLKELLTAVADNEQHEKIVVSRRKGWDDDDDDLLDL
ncbi:PDCD5-related protein [Trichoderma evansii]